MKNCVPGILIHHLPCRDRAGATCSKSWDNFLGFSKTVLLSVLPGNPALHPFIPALPPQLPQALTDSIFTEEITALFFCILILLREQIDQSCHRGRNAVERLQGSLLKSRDGQHFSFLGCRCTGKKPQLMGNLIS